MCEECKKRKTTKNVWKQFKKKIQNDGYLYNWIFKRKMVWFVNGETETWDMPIPYEIKYWWILIKLLSQKCWDALNY